jgi:Na+/proline symporter
MVGTLIYGWIVISEAGGLSGLADRIVDIYGSDLASQMLSFGPPDWSGEAVMPFLTIIGLQWFFQMNSDGTGYLAQRSMGCRTDRDARIAGVVFAWAQILFRSLIWLAIGVGILVLYPFQPAEIGTEGFTASREILFVQGVNDLLPPGVRGLMLTGLLAALASTVDTHLNWGASYWSNDVYKRLICRHWQDREPSSKELVVVARLSNLVIIVIALVIMANLGSIQTAWKLSLLFGAGVGAVLVLRWLWERINLYSELAAIAASLVTAPLLLYYLGTGDDLDYLRLAIMSFVTTVATVGITFFTPDTDADVLEKFYERVRPLGFWGKTAAATGHHPSAPRWALWNRLSSAAYSALSLFLLLMGFGRLMIQPPEASMLWTVVFIVAGLALIPLWWRDAFHREELEIDREYAEAHQDEAAS